MAINPGSSAFGTEIEPIAEPFAQEQRQSSLYSGGSGYYDGPIPTTSVLPDHVADALDGTSEGAKKAWESRQRGSGAQHSSSGKLLTAEQKIEQNIKAGRLGKHAVAEHEATKAHYAEVKAKAPASKPSQAKAATEPVTVTQKQAHPFVHTFFKEHPQIAEQKQYLAGVSKEKLTTALKLASGHEDASSSHVRKLIEKELDERADRGD